MENTLEKPGLDLEPFDPAKETIRLIKVGLNGFVVTDRDTRDLLFNMCKDANKALKTVDAKRLELLRPIKAEKKLLNDQLKKDLEPLTEIERKLEEYAKTELMDPLQGIINEKKTMIIDWDRKEAERVTKIEREAEEKRIADEKAAEEKQKGLSGIQKVEAKQEAEKVQGQDQEETQEKIHHETRKRTGRLKKIWNFKVLDINLVPDKYMIKHVNKLEVERVLGTVTEIPGLEITFEEKMMYQ